ncbi:MAG: hypothetical protein M3463_01575 [Verrucomicrobiota bacterium]|nr:hypothetical protein [Verrucomicrobiota bacterium]
MLPLRAQLATPVLEGSGLRDLDPLGKKAPSLLKPEKKNEPPKKEKGPTTILGDDFSMDQKANRAVFIGNVVVQDPEFDLTCDRLTALFTSAKTAANNPNAGKPDPKPPVPSPGTPPTMAEAGPAPAQSRLAKAIAEADGKNWVNITQEKLGADGKVSKNSGKAKKVEYDAATGDITLRGWPEVRQVGANSVIAEDESTVMILNRDGKMRSTGRTKVVLQETANDEDKTLNRDRR